MIKSLHRLNQRSTNNWPDRYLACWPILTSAFFICWLKRNYFNFYSHTHTTIWLVTQRRKTHQITVSLKWHGNTFSPTWPTASHDQFALQYKYCVMSSTLGVAVSSLQMNIFQQPLRLRKYQDQYRPLKIPISFFHHSTYVAVPDAPHGAHGGKTTDERAAFLLHTVGLHLDSVQHRRIKHCQQTCKMQKPLRGQKLKTKPKVSLWLHVKYIMSSIDIFSKRNYNILAFLSTHIYTTH